jgi:hypothetical protein
LYIDADATIVHTHTHAWLDLLTKNRGFDLVISREAEGPNDLIYSEGGAMRLNDATYVNTGVLLMHRSADGWGERMLRSWWDKADEVTDYMFSRTYDQGALGHLLYTHGTPMRRQPLSPSSPPQSFAQLSAERDANMAKAAWRRRISVVEPETLNNHAPGGSFAKAVAMSDVNQWWCQHFKHPILQLSGQSSSVRRSVLERVWQEGACLRAEADVEAEVSGSEGTSSYCKWLAL